MNSIQTNVIGKPKKNSLFFLVIFRSLILAILFSIISQFDVFGIKAATSLHSEAIFSRFFSSRIYPDNAQNEISVVLIGDDFLNATNQTWPMPYNVLSGKLAEIFAYEPKAVFIDILFQQRHLAKGKLESLMLTINAYKDSIPIYIPLSMLGSLEDATCNPSLPLTMKDIDQGSVIEKVRSLKINHSYIRWAGCGTRYPLYLGGNSRLPTPALSMFQAYCKLENYRPDICAEMKSLSSIKESFAEPMVIQWGGMASKKQQELMIEYGTPCNDTGFWAQLRSLIPQTMDSRKERGLRQLCPHTNTLNMVQFLTSTEDSHKLLTDYIRGRYVFIGANVAAIPDLIENPVNGKISGVYLLAMAFDNLINYGHNYFRELSVFEKILEEFLIIFVVLCLLDWSNHILRNRTRKFRFIVIKLLLPVVLCLLISYFFWYYCRQSPVDWIGISLIAFIMNPLSIYKDITDWLKRKSI
ncbi:MAG: CHASE2 domain-containing protein [Methyloprofundus sp.]|nr:CHASE2 domain-containing protein [Methyloprofundus sp.]